MSMFKKHVAGDKGWYSFNSEEILNSLKSSGNIADSNIYKMEVIGVSDDLKSIVVSVTYYSDCGSVMKVIDYIVGDDGAESIKSWRNPGL